MSREKIQIRATALYLFSSEPNNMIQMYTIPIYYTINIFRLILIYEALIPF